VSLTLTSEERSPGITVIEERSLALTSEERSLALTAEERSLEIAAEVHRMRDRSQAILLSYDDCTVCKSECSLKFAESETHIKIFVACHTQNTKPLGTDHTENTAFIVKVCLLVHYLAMDVLVLHAYASRNIFTESLLSSGYRTQSLRIAKPVFIISYVITSYTSNENKRVNIPLICVR
jgi:hypothetical protein